MAPKAAYEELEKRVKELEKERAASQLDQSVKKFI